MAKDIHVQGIDLDDVPAIDIPLQTSGTARFYDCTGTKSITQNGSGIDVKGYAAVDVNVSGGGGGAVKTGVLRPDAELVDKWTMDKYVVADLNLTIPSYSTTNATIRAGQNLATYVGDPLSYRYFITARTLTIPEYSITTLAKGREEYAIEYGFYEWLYNPTGQMQTLDDSKEYGVYSQIIGGGYGRELYWSSATGIGIYTSDAYCARQGLTAPTIASNKTLTIKSPNISIRGHATYLAQTFFDAIEDIRCQYVVELWRVPLTGVDGWVLGTQMDSIFTDIANGGTLT